MQAQTIPQLRQALAPSEHPWKVYQFNRALLMPDGHVSGPFWCELAACYDEHSAATTRNLWERALPEMHFVMGRTPPTHVPDSNLYDMDGNVVKQPEPQPAKAPPKPERLTPQKVHAILKAAGHQHVGRFYWSKEDRCHRWGRDGFRTGGKPGKGYVTVEHTAAVNPDLDSRKVATAKCLEYKAALEAAGLVVSVNEWKGVINWLECRLP